MFYSLYEHHKVFSMIAISSQKISVATDHPESDKYEASILEDDEQTRNESALHSQQSKLVNTNSGTNSRAISYTSESGEIFSMSHFERSFKDDHEFHLLETAQGY